MTRRRQTDKEQGESLDTSTRVLLSGIAILTLAHLASSWVPGINVWGFDHWSEFPGGVAWALTAFVGICLIPAVAKAIDRVVSAIPVRLGTTIIAFLGAGILLYAFRVHAYAYGDGYTYTDLFVAGEFPVLIEQMLTHSGDLRLHWLVHKLLVMPSGGAVATTYAIVAVISGLLTLAAVNRIAIVLCRDRSGRRGFIIAAALTSGAVAFWFGYVEAYNLTQTAALWSLAFAVEAPTRPKRLPWSWALWIIASAFHLLALVFLPALLWSTWLAEHRERRPWSRGRVATAFGLGMLAAALGALAISLQGYQLLDWEGTRVFVGLLPTTESTYSAFSLDHLRDVANLLVLTAPLGLVGMALWFLSPKQNRTGRPEAQLARSVLAVAAGGAFYFAFWVDPLLGAFRDWDLLSCVGLPFTLWGAAMLASRSDDYRRHRWRWVPVAALVIVHLGGFVGALQDEVQGAMRVDRLVREDVHYTGDFHKGTRLMSWGALLIWKLDRSDLARDHFSHRVRLEPNDVSAWANLGTAYRHLDEFDSAAACLERALELKPNILHNWRKLGELHVWRGDNEAARLAFERVISLSDTSYTYRVRLGRVYIDLGMYKQADSILAEATALIPDLPVAYAFRGDAAQHANDTALAIASYEACLKRNGQDEETYRRLTLLYQMSGQMAEARYAVRRWDKAFRGSAIAPFILGTIFVTAQQYDSANAAFTRSVDRSPLNALSTYYLATTYRHLKQPDRAKELAIRAAQLDPALSLPYLELVYLAADAGDQRGAVDATREYLARSPADSSMEYLRQFMVP